MPRKELKPEERVRQDVLAQLKALGWKDTRLQWKPEWRVPDTPHDLTKRERGQSYKACGKADLVAFADDSGEAHALQVIFEFKEPTIDKGRLQLMRYLSNEPVARVGFWTNGSERLAVYKSHTNDWIYDSKTVALPAPGDDLTQPPAKAPTWNDLETPKEAQLATALRRIVATVVVADSRVTRREDQLRELLHVVLVKVDGDAWAAQPGNQRKPHPFRVYGDKQTMAQLTADEIRRQYHKYFTKQKASVFHPDDRDELLLTDETILAVVDALAPWRILGDSVDLLAKAFQVFRTQALKSGEGQFLTPLRVIRPSVMLMGITSQDKVIDPACGTGGFVIEALRQVQEREFPDESEAWGLMKFANENLYAVDIDSIGTKLTRAMMLASRANSTHVLLGDSIRRHLWRSKFPELQTQLGDRREDIAASFTVVITNPPFGEDLRIKASDARAAGYTITEAAAMDSGKGHVDLEIGLIYLELAHRLLQMGGRVGIVLPETYFFSYKYRWLPGWLDTRLALRGMFNIPMEAFEEFCRAKTNFYIFEKVGDGSRRAGASRKSTIGEEALPMAAIDVPDWFSEDTVTVSTAPTCGLTKGGRLLPRIDEHGERIQIKDLETGMKVDAINDVYLDDAVALARRKRTDTLRDIPASSVSLRAAVPIYYDRRYHERFAKAMGTPRFKSFEAETLGSLIGRGVIDTIGGHGSPSSDQRVGDVPYIKVSDLRAGLVNINPTNRVPLRLAEKLWGGKSSRLRAFDILSPERTSKNIGDFCLLMPGQEQVVLTKEIIVMRPGTKANFDAFYLLWAMTLKIVREQWKRVVFMQTNREDVGRRWLEIEIPVPKRRATADRASAAFRDYYTVLARARGGLGDYLRTSGEHHFYVSGTESPGEAVVADDRALS
jgi:hypothetical protein